MYSSQDEERAQLRGALHLVRDGIDQTTARVQEVHRAIARQPFAVLKYLPVVNVGSELLRPIVEGMTAGVYGSIRAINRLVFLGIDRVLDHVE